ncbi:MAG: hypothetical protein Q7S10_02725 [bacterium]|nr:hypothetical protein [bacterium]
MSAQPASRIAKPTTGASTHTPPPRGIINLDGKNPTSDGKSPQKAGNLMLIEEIVRKVMREERTQPGARLVILIAIWALLATACAIFAVGYISAGKKDVAPKVEIKAPDAKTLDATVLQNKEAVAEKNPAKVIPQKAPTPNGGRLAKKAPDTEDYRDIEVMANKVYNNGSFRTYRITVTGKIMNASKKISLTVEPELSNRVVIGEVAKSNLANATFEVDATNVMGHEVILRETDTSKEICRLEIPPPGALSDTSAPILSAPGGGNTVFRLPMSPN